jgi:hypothetical protein
LIFIGTVISFLTVPFCYGQNGLLQTARLIGEKSKFHSLSLRAGNTSLPVLKTHNYSDSIVTKPIEKKFRMKKSPWLAVLFSGVVPGFGQVYNQSYWKVPIILGLAGYLSYEIFDNHKKYKDYRNQYAATQTPENPYGDENLKTLREFYRDQRDDFIWYFTIVYVINLVDAYVDAHLFDFNVSEEKIEHNGKIDREYKLNLKVRF